MLLYIFTQAVEELLESLDLEKSSYHMGLSRVSKKTSQFNVPAQTFCFESLPVPFLFKP